VSEGVREGGREREGERESVCCLIVSESKRVSE
jgi:hypothetical protein